MAKQVKNSDLVQPNLWKGTVEETEALIVVLKNLEKSFKEVSAEAAKTAKNASPGNAKGIKDINAATELLKKTSIETDKVRAQIATAETQRTKAATAAAKQRATEEKKALNDRDKVAKTLLKQRETREKQAEKAAIDRLKEREKVQKDVEKRLLQIQKDKATQEKQLAAEKKRIDQEEERANKRTIAELNKSIKARERKIIVQKKEEAATERLAKRTKEGNRAYNKASAELNTLRKRFKDLAISGKGTKKEMAALLFQITKLDTKLKAVDRTVGQSQRNVGNYQSAFKGLGKVLGKAGGLIGIAAAGLTAFAAGARLAIPLFREFGLVSAKVQAVSGATASEFEALQTQAKALGETTPFTAANVAQLQLELSKLGFVANEITASTEAILNFAIATDSELGRSAEVVASTLNAFNLEAGEAGRVADVAAKAFASSALDIEKFATAIGSVGPAANAVDVSLERTTAILGKIVDSGIDASTAGTQLRNVFIELESRGLTWNEAIDQINGSQNRLSAANELFGKRGAVVSTVIANNVDEIDKLDESLQNAAGSSKAAADIIGDTLDGDIKRLTSALQGATLENKGFEDVLRSVVQFLTEAIPPVFDVLVNLFKVLLPLMKPVLFAFEVLAEGIRGVTDAIGLSVKEVDAFTKATEEAKQANEDFENQLQAEFITLGSLRDKITDVNTSQEERAELIKLVNNEYAEYLPSLISEEDSLEKITEKLNDATSAMIKRQILMKEEERIAEALAKQIEDRADDLEFQEKAQKRLNKLLEDQILLDKLRFEQLNDQDPKKIKELSDALELTNTSGAVGIINVSNRIEDLERDLIDARAAVEGVNESIANAGEFNAIKAITDSIDDLLASFGLVRDELKKDDEDPKKPGGGGELTQEDLLAKEKLTIEQKFQRDKLQLLKDADADVEKEKNKIFTTDVQRDEEINKIKKSLDENLNDLEIERLQKLTSKRFEILKKDDDENIALKQDLQTKLTKVTTDGIEERADAQKKSDDESEKADKIRAENRLKQTKALQEDIKDGTIAAIDVLDQAFAKSSQNRLDEIDRETAALKTREGELRQAAQNGSELAKDNLATNQRLQAEQERIRDEQVKKAQRREIVLAGIKAFAENAGEPGAVQKTLSDITTLSAALLNLPFLFEGTEDTGTASKSIDSNGGRLAVIHDNERVMTKKQNAMMGGLSNDDVANIVHDHVSPTHFDHAPMVQVQRFESNAEVLQKFDVLAEKLDNLPNRMPRIVDEKFDEKSKVYTTVVKTGNKVEKNHKRIDGIWG